MLHHSPDFLTSKLRHEVILVTSRSSDTQHKCFPFRVLDFQIVVMNNKANSVANEKLDFIWDINILSQELLP